MDINRANLETILADVAVHYKHACDKHPYFADVFFHLGEGEEPPKRFLESCRGMIARAKAVGKLDTIRVLNCEIAEVIEAYARKDMEQAREECLDAIAVLMRMVDVIDGLQPLGKDAVCADCPFFRTIEGSGNPEPTCTNPMGECEKKKTILAQGK